MIPPILRQEFLFFKYTGLNTFISSTNPEVTRTPAILCKRQSLVFFGGDRGKVDRPWN